MWNGWLVPNPQAASGQGSLALAAAQNWSGAGSSTYVRTSDVQVQALDAVMGADQGTARGSARPLTRHVTAAVGWTAWSALPAPVWRRWRRAPTPRPVSSWSITCRQLHNRRAVVAGGGPAAQQAVKAALTKLGTPYVWGANGPNNFDCCGLTLWAHRQPGITLGPDTYTQIKDVQQVAPGNVQAGGLIFSKYSWDSRGPAHVQLAISPTEVVRRRSLRHRVGKSGISRRAACIKGLFCASPCVCETTLGGDRDIHFWAGLAAMHRR